MNHLFTILIQLYICVIFNTKFIILCDYEVKNLEKPSEITDTSASLQNCECIYGNGLVLTNCLYSCDLYDTDGVFECFWSCSNKPEYIKSTEVRECLCYNVTQSVILRPCQNFRSLWGRRSIIHGCCRTNKTSYVAVCVGEPEETDKMEETYESGCNANVSQSHRMSLMCRITKELSLANNDKLFRVTSLMLLRIADYVNTKTLPVIDGSVTTGLSTPRTKTLTEICASCPKKFRYFRLPIWVTAVAGVGGLILGVLISVCISRCLLRPLSKRELKQAIMTASEAGHSDQSSNPTSRAPLIATSSLTLSTRRYPSSSDGNQESYDRRHVIGVSNTSAEFHQYESLTRLGMLPGSPKGLKVTLEEPPQDNRSSYLEPTCGPGCSGDSSLGNIKQSKLERAKSHEYFALEDMVNIKRTSSEKCPESQRRDYLTVIDDAESVEDGSPEKRQGVSEKPPNDYYVLESQECKKNT